MQKIYVVQTVVYVCQMSKLQHVCNRFNTSFCTKNHKTYQAISNSNLKFWNKLTLIWVSFLRVLFIPLSHWNYEFHNDTFIWVFIHILHPVCTTSLTNLCFNLLLPGVSFFVPSENIRKPRILGVQKGAPGSNGLIWGPGPDIPNTCINTWD